MRGYKDMMRLGAGGVTEKNLSHYLSRYLSHGNLLCDSALNYVVTV